MGIETSKYLQELNEAQLAAVKASDGPVLIIAGPGSGKTRVLTYRIAYLIDNKTDAFRILALTFTNKAAKEMRHRITEIVGEEARNLWMGTFHSIFARMLRFEAHRLNYPSHFSIYDTQDSKSLIKKIIKEMGLDIKTYKDGYVLGRISSAKNALLSPVAYARDIEMISEDESSGKGKIHEIYAEYAKRCFNAGAMDFDDLLFKTHELLSNFPEVLHKYRNRFTHILIDEFQDTNFAQYSIIKLLGAVHENICVVGDDAQSIYGFRGATIHNILNLHRDYPDLQTFKLEQNYRSIGHIVEAANQIIKNNKNQHAKTIWTNNKEGDQISVVKHASDNDEGAWIAGKIFDLKMRRHLSNNEFAILYRTNAQSRAIEEALRRKNLPYKIYGGLSFYQRKEVKDLLAYLRVVINPKDEEALRRIINYPTRGIGNTTLEKVTIWAKENDCSIWDVICNIRSFGLSARAVNAIEGFTVKMRSFQAMLDSQNAYDLAKHIAKSVGLQSMLYNDKSVEGVNRFDNYQELLNSIKEFTVNDEVVEEGIAEDDRSLGAYLQSVALLTDADSADADADQVKLMTIHAAKGLEFEAVFVGGMEENLFPSIMSSYSREDLEEERRLFYVAVTRAKGHLFLSYATSRFKFGDLIFPEPSRFLDEIPDKHISYEGLEDKKPVENRRSFKGLKVHKKVPARHVPPKREIKDFVASPVESLLEGMRVVHQRFGQGQIIELDGNDAKKMATVDFDDHGNKKLLLKFAKLMQIE